MATTVVDQPRGVRPTSRRGRWLRRAAVASLVVNIAIVVTGGVVRLTGSGLGCPTWPQCTPGSFVPHRALGIHGTIEFSNRMVTFVLVAVAVSTLVLAWRSSDRVVRRLALLLALAVPAQAVIGGASVLTDLNPWVVSFHLLVSMAMVGVSVVLLERVRVGPPAADPARALAAPVAWLARSVFVVGWAVLYLGTVVTGSGPHAGDVSSPRNGLHPRALTQLHADAVFLLVGLTLATVLVAGVLGVPRLAQRAAVALLLVEVAQALIGFAQYVTDLPVALVALHLLGAALISAALTWLLVSFQGLRPHRA